MALLCLLEGCARQPQAPPAYVIPVIGLPPIPVEQSRPGIDPHDIPSAETILAIEPTIRLDAEQAASRLERRPVRLGYPAEARQLGLSGFVRFQVVIAADGTVQGLTLLETSNNLFVRAATATVESYQYRAYLVDGKPVAVDTTVRVEFELPPAQQTLPNPTAAPRDSTPRSAVQSPQTLQASGCAAAPAAWPAQSSAAGNLPAAPPGLQGRRSQSPAAPAVSP